jgi:transcriptional regulator with XRE-family HTH domain
MFINKKFFGLYIAKKRMRNGISQAVLAEKLGYGSGQFVSNWERGNSLPPMDKIPKLAQELKIPVQEIIDVITSETAAYLRSELLNKGTRRRVKGRV